MKAIDSLAYLVCAGVLAAASGGSHAPRINAQSSQSQTDSQARQLEQQPPKINPDREWNAAVAFMQANCPNRIAFASKLQNQPLKFDRVRALMLRQYRTISNIKDAQLHEVAVRHAQIEDQIFGAQLKIKNARDARTVLDAKTELRNADEQWVNVEIVAKQLRIARLQAELDHFQKLRQKYINDRFNNEIKEATNNNPNGPGRETQDAINEQQDDNNSAAPPVGGAKK